MKNITISNLNMVETVQFTIIQAFTAHWEIKFERMVANLDFLQKAGKEW